jgi:hypothetical protein
MSPEDAELSPMHEGYDVVRGLPFSIYCFISSEPSWPMSTKPQCLLLANVITVITTEIFLFIFFLFGGVGLNPH